MTAQPTASVRPPAQLGLWDTASLLVGVVIGTGIFQSPHDVFQNVGSRGVAILIWVAAGVFSFIGALTFAELAGVYPRSGGEYVYLSRALGRFAGFLFAWAQLTLIRPGGVAVLAYVAGECAARLFGGDIHEKFLYATLAIVLTLGINVLGLRLGALIQNGLTLLKIVGVAAIVLAGCLLMGRGTATEFTGPMFESVSLEKVGTALIFVFWTYDGWNEATYVVSDVRDNQRTVPRALLLGTLFVVVIYVLVNLAFIVGLGQEIFSKSDEILPSRLLRTAWPVGGYEAIQMIVLISALGAINATIFSTARLGVVFAEDHALFGPLRQRFAMTGAPAVSVIVQSAISVALVLLVWVRRGDRSTFDATIELTAAVFWAFFAMAALSLFVLRVIDPDRPRPFRVPGYPVLPALFVVLCCFMAQASFRHNLEFSLYGLVIVSLGIPFYFLSKGQDPAMLRTEPPPEDPACNLSSSSTVSLSH